MLIDELFSSLETASPCKYQGHWYRIQWIPSLTTGERLNIGVVFVCKNHQKYTRMLDNPNRFDRLYGESAAFHVDLACQVANDIVELVSDPEEWDAPQVKFDRVGFAQGDTIDEILGSLYEDMIPDYADN